ncbi:MAG: hypothetical protein AWM53_01479 [Candidatus Dichloromethanomonas elyunquensis]|nr:MAG: hypothetical protein AWM53_01479 [Candidatus Dichloromethanomonas elyunquensis]
MKVNVNWGQDTIAVDLPQNWQYKGGISSRKRDGLKEGFVYIRESLANPTAMLPLSKRDLSGQRVVIVVDDITRPTPVKLLFPEVMAELLKAGVKKNEVKVLFALGNHRPMTRVEMLERLGLDSTAECSLLNHQWDTPQALEEVGVTGGGLKVTVNRELIKADLVVLIGTIEPHPIAGFGGGLKNIIPGCAGRETIAGTHLIGDAAIRFSSVGKIGDESLSRRLLEEGAFMVPTEYFLVNTVLTSEGRIAGVFCGHPVLAHRQGCRLALEIYGTVVERKADVLLAESTPMDIDFWQGSKVFSNGSGGLKEGGVLIAFLRCSQGIGDLALSERTFLPPDLMRLFAQECGVEKLVDIREKHCGALKTEERFMMELFTELCRRHHILVYVPTSVPVDIGEKLGFFELFHDLDKLMNRAAILAPREAVVYTLSHGGTTFVNSTQ